MKKKPDVEIPETLVRRWNTGGRKLAKKRPFIEVSSNWPPEAIEELRRACEKDGAEFSIMQL